MLDKSEGKNAKSLQKEQEEHNGSNNLYHNGIETLATELQTAESNFFDDGLGLDDPANKDAAGDSNNRHKDVVADIVENVENLCNTAVGKGELKVEDVVAEADNNTHKVSDNRYDDSGLSAAPSELIHTAGDNGFKQGYGGGESCKNNGDKEDDTDNVAGNAHCGKNLGHGDKHKAGACGHALGAHKGKDSGNDHKTGKECHDSIKELDAVDALDQIGVLLNVGTIGDHNTHSNGNGVEELTHCVSEDNKELLEGHTLKVGNYINQQTLKTGAGNAAFVGVTEGEREDGDANDEHKKDGHQNLGKTLNAGVNTLVYYENIGCKENGEPNEGAPLSGYKAGEITVGSGFSAGKGYIGCKILQNPAAYSAVVGKNHNGNNAGNNADPTHFLAEDSVCSEGTLAGFASDSDFGSEKRETEGYNKNKINKQEHTAAVFCGKIGETPDVAKTDSAAGCGKNESQRTGESASCRFIFHIFSPLSK